MEKIKPSRYVVTSVMIRPGFLSCFVQILLTRVTAVTWPMPSILFSWPSSVFSSEFTQSHLNAAQIYWSRAVVSGEPPCFPLTGRVLLFVTYYYSASEKIKKNAISSLKHTGFGVKRTVENACMCKLCLWKLQWLFAISAPKANNLESKKNNLSSSNEIYNFISKYSVSTVIAE